MLIKLRLVSHACKYKYYFFSNKEESMMSNIVKAMNTPVKGKELMRENGTQNFCQLKPMNQKQFLREAYCKLLEEYLDKLGKREHWGKTLEWKMKKFPSEAREILELWAIIYSKELDLLDENVKLSSSLKFLDEESIMLDSKEYDNSLYSHFIKVLESC